MDIEQRSALIQDEYRARYRAEVEDELRQHEPDWQQEYPEKRAQMRDQLRDELEQELWDKVCEMFPDSCGQDLPRPPLLCGYTAAEVDESMD